MFRPKIVFLDANALGEVSLSGLAELGELSVYQSTRPDQRIERIAGNDVIITNKVIIDKDVMDACDSIKLICISATGMNNVDLKYASQKKIPVKNVAAYSTESVVQHTFAMLFYLMEKLPYYNDYVRKGNYSQSILFTHHGSPFHELAAKKYGIIGLGTIGKRVAEIAQAFNAHVTYYSTSQKNFDIGYKHVPLDVLLSESDIISIHSPLNDITHNLIGYDQFRLMKREAILINVGRGGIINETDLSKALNEGLIAGAGLDVLAKEPPEESNPLFKLKNPEKLLITPHIAWASIESRERLVKGIVNNIEEFLNSM